jgi:hypothetical protein
VSTTGISDLLKEYDELTDVVANATHTLHQAALSKWFSLLDETPMFAREVSRLEKLNDFDAWHRALESRQRSHGMGSTSLNFAPDREAALGMQVALFRRMAKREIKAELFAHVYITPNESNINRGLNEFSKQIFMPAARALRRRLERAADTPDIEPLLLVPASDRTVTFDHNSPDYVETVRSLENLEQAVQQSNDYPDQEDKEQRLAELSAGRRILQAARARSEVIIALLYRCLLYIAKKFADVAIGAVAVGTLAVLGRLTGLW